MIAVFIIGFAAGALSVVLSIWAMSLLIDRHIE